MSSRNYWTTEQLINDWNYWKNSFPTYNREKAYASWRVLLKRWNVPEYVSIDEFCRKSIEGS